MATSHSAAQMAALSAAYHSAASSASNYNSGTGTNSSLAGASQSGTGSNSSPATTSSTPSATALLQAQQLAQAATGTLPTNPNGSKAMVSPAAAAKALADKTTSSLSGYVANSPLAKLITGQKDYTTKAYTPDYVSSLFKKSASGSLNDTEKSELQYLMGANSKPGDLYYDILYPGSGQAQSQTQDALDETLAFLKSVQSYTPEYNAYTPQYAPIPALGGNVPSISTNGDNVIPTISALALADAREQANAEQALQSFIATSNAQNSNNNNTVSALGVLSGLLNNLMDSDYQNRTLDSTNQQNAAENERALQSAAATRIVAGIGTASDYALLGIPYGTIPYAQLNALVQQDIDRQKNELYGLGLTV